MKEKYEKKDKNSKENSKLIKAFPKLMFETKEIFLKNEREKWDFKVRNLLQEKSLKLENHMMSPNNSSKKRNTAHGKDH